MVNKELKIMKNIIVKIIMIRFFFPFVKNQTIKGS